MQKKGSPAGSSKKFPCRGGESIRRRSTPTLSNRRLDILHSSRPPTSSSSCPLLFLLAPSLAHSLLRFSFSRSFRFFLSLSLLRFLSLFQDSVRAYNYQRHASPRTLLERASEVLSSFSSSTYSAVLRLPSRAGSFSLCFSSILVPAVR